MNGADTWTVHTSRPSVRRTAATTSPVAPAWDADQAVTELYRTNYQSVGDFYELARRRADHLHLTSG
jgi:hypothetical protein